MNKCLALLILPSLLFLSIVAGIAHEMGIEPRFPSPPQVAGERTAPDSGRVPAPRDAASPSKRMTAKSAATTPGDALPTNTLRWQ
ncbi:MAG: hypothetical protein IT364_27525 [Candidatus Hydrogenedentes bacterium]|nr:hypothetical protein [Candidatus Hydrogenedentota bacterium]